MLHIKTEIKRENEEETILYEIHGVKESVSDFYGAVNSACDYYRRKDPLSPKMQIVRYDGPLENAENYTLVIKVPAQSQYLYLLERCAKQSMNTDLTASRFYTEYKTQKRIRQEEKLLESKRQIEEKIKEKEIQEKELEEDLILLFGESEEPTDETIF